MRKIRSLSILLLVALLLAACSASSPAATTVSSGGQVNTTSAQASTTDAVQTTSSAATPAAPAALLSETHEDADDYAVDTANTSAITFNGDSISAGGSGVQVDGSTVTITAPGDYRLRGTLTDGQVVVNSTQDGNVRLILDGVSLSSSTSAPVNIIEADEVILILADGTQNTVTDAQTYVYPSQDVDEPNAAIFSKADLSIAGNGALTVTGNFNDGIASKDGLIIAGGSLTVNAVDDGIRGKDYVVVEGGSLTVTAQGDGVKADNAEDAALGYIAVSAGTLNVAAGGDAINAQTQVAITGGDFTLTTSGGAGSRAAETESAKGIKGTSSVVIDGGTFHINAADDAIHANGTITINNGTFQVASTDDAVHADQALTINSGDIQVTQSYEGLESAVITLNNGTVHVTASDDGVNVANGNDGSGLGPGMGRPGAGGPGMGGGGQDASTYTGSNWLYINGGYLYVDAQGDGIDVNGAMIMTDGVVLVNGPTEQMNGAMDYDGGFNQNGGLLVAAGSSGMAMTAGSYSQQNAALVYLSSAQPGGTPVSVVNSAGEVVFTFTPTHDYQSIAFSSPKLASGETYTVYTGGSTTGTATDGLAQDGSYTPGTQAATFTVSSTVTQVDSGGGVGGGGRGPRP